MAARGVFRGVYSALFDDSDYQHLPPPARLVLLTVRLCANAGLPVIFTYSVDTLMRQTGYRRQDIETALKTLQAGGWIERDASLLWVRNGLKYDPLVRPEKNPKHRSAVIRWLEGLPKHPLVLRFCDYYQIPYPFERVSDTHAIGPFKEKEKEEDKEKTLLFADVARATSADTRTQFHIPDPITAALGKAPRLSRSPRLQQPDFWQAQIRAHRSVNFPAELLKAEAWLVANPRKNLPRFLANWFNNAHGDP